MKSIKRSIVILAISGVLSGCLLGDVRVSLMDASLTDDRRLTVSMPMQDLARIAKKEIYFRVVLFECQEPTRRFPIPPDVEGVPSDDFSALREKLSSSAGPRPMRLSASVHPPFARALREPCVRAEGGSYLGGKLSSNVLRARRAGSARAGDAATLKAGRRSTG